MASILIDYFKDFYIDIFLEWIVHKTTMCQCPLGPSGHGKTSIDAMPLSTTVSN